LELLGVLRVLCAHTARPFRFKQLIARSILLRILFEGVLVFVVFILYVPPEVLFCFGSSSTGRKKHDYSTKKTIDKYWKGKGIILFEVHNSLGFTRSRQYWKGE
jgi:hypothetical protein